MVHVVDEHIDGREALQEATFDAPPLVGSDDTGDHVERPGAVDAAPVRVHGERDAHAHDVELGQVLTLLQLGEPEALQLLHEFGGSSTWAAVGFEKLVPQVGGGAQFGHAHPPTVSTRHFRSITRL